ncbi:MAG: hypothetical protein WC872_00785 [Candidatus Absconditabacterales bacterium]
MAINLTKPSVSYKFSNIIENEQQEIKDIVEKNINGKLDSYLKKIYSKKENAEVRIEYNISQNKQKKYEASFLFHYDGKMFPYINKIGFKYIPDLVNHAFKHFKEFLSNQNI